MNTQKELLLRIFDTIPVLLIMWDARLQRFTLNRHAEEVLGWSTEDANQGDFLAKVYPDPDYRAQIVDYMQSLRPGWREWQTTAKDGSIIPCEWANIGLAGEDMIGIGIDLRQRRKADEALRLSEARFRTMVETAAEGIVFADPSGPYLYVNGRMAEMLDYPPEEILGKSSLDFTFDGWQPQVLQAREDLNRGRLIQGEFKFRRRDGTALWSLYNATSLYSDRGEHIGNLAMHTDISERKQAEKALRLSEEKFAKAFHTNPAAMALVTMEGGRILDVNETWLTVFGFRRREVIDKTTVELNLWADPGRRLAAVEQFRRAGFIRSQEEQFRRKSGETLPVLLSLDLITLEEQEVAVVTMEDISERKRAREALQASEEKYRALFSQSSAGIYLHDLEGRILEVNQIACLQSGYSQDELLGLHIFDLHPSETSTSIQEKEEILQAWQQWRPGHRFTMEAEHLRKDGTVYPIALAASLISYGDQKLIMAMVNDISERKQWEEEISLLNRELEQRVEQRTRQLRDLAMELTGAEDRERERLAHLLHDDLQQKLAAIRMYLLLLVPQGAMDATTRKRVDAAVSLVDRSIAETRQLSRKLYPTTLRLHGLNSALERLAEDMAREYGLEVNLRLSPEANIRERRTASILYRSVNELLFNVIKHAGSQSATVDLHSEHGEVIVTVSDDGCGCEPRAAWTKAMESQSLGLASIEERITYLDGAFTLDAAPGKGFQVTLRVPAAPEPGPPETAPQPTAAPSGEKAGEPAPAVPEAKDAGKGKITILMADDHLLVREAIATLLAQEDDLLVVGQAADGHQALELAAEHAPDVVLMDVNMPGMNGIEATTKLREQSAGIIVIGLSMHDDPTTHEMMRQAGAVETLSKSGSIPQLCNSIRKWVRGRSEQL